MSKDLPFYFGRAASAMPWRVVNARFFVSKRREKSPDRIDGGPHMYADRHMGPLSTLLRLAQGTRSHTLCGP